jgi:hypothetical protein
MIESSAGGNVMGFFEKGAVRVFPWKEPKERIPLAVRQIRSFLRAHRAATALAAILQCVIRISRGNSSAVSGSLLAAFLFSPLCCVVSALCNSSVVNRAF